MPPILATVERPKPRRIERRQIEAACCAFSDQLRQCFAGRGRIEDAPDIVAGANKRALKLRQLSDQRQAVLRHRAEAGLPRDDALGAECR